MKTPTPKERPDLYDNFDLPERPAGYQTGVQTPDYLRKMIDERKAKQGGGEEKPEAK